MGRRKKIVQQCERLMDKPDQIRNIAIAAHIDHGKCVAPDTRISLADGSVLPAVELFDRIKSDGMPVEDVDGAAYAPATPVDVAAFDRSTGETETGSVQYATKRTVEDSLLRVSTANGHTLTTTPEHRYLTLTSTGVMEFTRAERLDPGDVIIGARQVPTEQQSTKAAFLRSLVAETDWLATVGEPLSHELGELSYEELPETATSMLTASEFEQRCQQDTFHLSELLTIAEEVDRSLGELYGDIAALAQEATAEPVSFTPPSSLQSLFYIAGTLIDGGDITPVAAEVSDRLGALALGPDPPMSNADLRDSALGAVLAAAFGLDIGSNSERERLPELVFTAGGPETAAFLHGYLESNATLEAATESLVLSAPPTSCLEDLQLLLYQFDIASDLDREDHTLRIAGELSLRHLAETGYEHAPKPDRFQVLLESAASAGLDRVPIDGQLLADIRSDLDLDPASLPADYPEYEANEIELTKQTLGDVVNRFATATDDPAEEIRIDRLQSLATADSSCVEVTGIERVDGEAVFDFGVPDYQNFIAEGLVVHNTTLTDNLLAGAGMISSDLAGQQLAMDTEEDEQERGITIDAANVSMTHEFEGDDYLVNLIDTPGHVDFGGDVTRAMRAVDGALVVVDAVEGTMPQTETVLRQALREDVKPALFINKVDRLINELREGPEEMQERLQTVIRDVNELIRGIAPDRYEEDNWQVSVQDGTVAFGSALYNWAISLPFMQETGIDFADIIDYNENENVDELREQSPLADVVLNMVAEHFPSPVDAQPRRIPTIWRGDDTSTIADQMREVDDDGEVVFMVTDIGIDPHAGEIATGRLFSGTIEKGQELNVSGTAGTNRIQSVGIFMGGEREEVEEVPAGNIAAVTGLPDAIAGSTVSSTEMTPFESIEHISQPVITKSIEAESMDDLPKLIEVLQQVSKEDPTLKVEINEDTGEHLIHGQGELHLEVQTQRIERNNGIPVRTGEPIVVYREAPQRPSDELEGISPNRHNRFYISVEPLDDDVVEQIMLGNVSMDMPELERREALQEVGFDKEASQNLETIIGPNLVIDDTKGIQHLNETMELVVEGFEEGLNEGPLAAEPVQGALVRLLDARLHEDAIHRGPAQVIPAVREALHRALIDAHVKLLEPMQDVRIDVPAEHMGPASSEIQGRRGRVDDMFQEGDRMVLEGVAPVGEMIGFSSDIRSATEGRASWNTENAGFEVLADNLQREIIMEIRERKGMKTELPPSIDYF